MKARFFVFVVGVVFARLVNAGPATRPAYRLGLSQSPDYFPVAVWLQDPKNAEKFKEIGINLYLALWKGPTEAQLKALEKAQMPVICEFNGVGVKNKIIVGWMQRDEPDNAQALPNDKGYGPPVLPEKVVEGYQKTKKADPDRPVLLNLGQGVAWDNWYGRGTRTNKPEDYPEYLKGCDIASFDIYPVVHDHKEVAGKLEFVAHGVDRLRKWTDEKKPVWACIETTRIGNVNKKPTPAQVRSEIWMAIIHGARGGLIYFSHQFKPNFIEAGLLADEEMARGVKEINRRIRELAPVINEGKVVQVAGTHAGVDVMGRKYGGAVYVFAAEMRNEKASGEFKIADPKGTSRVEVIGEKRFLETVDGAFVDEFAGYGVHLYRVGEEQ